MLQLDDMLLRAVPPDFKFDAQQLAIGQQVELEHTEDMEAAKIIAKHHLLEDRDYYRKLRRFHLDGDSMDVPCVNCAPSIQVNGPSLLSGGNVFEKASWAIGTLGFLTAAGGLVAKKPVLTKVAGAVGVIGGVGSLILAMIRTNASNQMISDMQNEASTAAKALDAVNTYAESVQLNGEQSMVDVLLGGSMLAANAIALLLVPAR
jgi:hypothetical protein